MTKVDDRIGDLLLKPGTDDQTRIAALVELVREIATDRDNAVVDMEDLINEADNDADEATAQLVEAQRLHLTDLRAAMQVQALLIVTLTKPPGAALASAALRISDLVTSAEEEE